MDKFGQLRAQLDFARDQYQRALEAQSDVLKPFGELPHPDGSDLIRQVNQTVRAALERYTAALEHLTDYVLNHAAPDLKQLECLPLSVEILLIEDSISEARLVQEITAHDPALRIIQANDCSTALARLSDRHLKPKLVIADLGVLEFGGVELMKQCTPRGIPVVVFSGSRNPTDRQNVLRLGAKEFVEKPGSLAEYTAAVWKMITKWAVVPPVVAGGDTTGTATPGG